MSNTEIQNVNTSTALAAGQPIIEIPADLKLARLHVFQDVGNEADTWGDHPKGTILDGDTKEVVPPDTRVMILAARYRFERRPDGGGPVMYEWYTDSYSGILTPAQLEGIRAAGLPVEDFVWDRTNPDAPKPPAVDTHLELVVVSTHNPMPVLIVWRNQDIKTGEVARKAWVFTTKVLKRFVQFKLGTVENRNDYGKWRAFQLTQDGAPCDALRAQLAEYGIKI
jgi:hypothetical protein